MTTISLDAFRPSTSSDIRTRRPRKSKSGFQLFPQHGFSRAEPLASVRAGVDIADYQPVHENGNILSYLALQPPVPAPSDVGIYSAALMARLRMSLWRVAALQAFGGQSQTPQALSLSSGSGGGSVRSYSHTLSESADVTVAGSASVRDFGEGGEIRASADINFHNSNSWGGTATSKTTNKSTSITLSQPSGSSNQEYPTIRSLILRAMRPSRPPILRITRRRRKIIPVGAEFWASFYGRGPDPALNLPGRFMPHFDFGMVIHMDPSHQSSGSNYGDFFFASRILNPMTNDYDYLSSTPVQGDKVRVDTRVYNYSTGVSFDNLLVRFQAVEVDQDTLEEIDPRTGQVLGPHVQLDPSLRTTIAETTASYLDASGHDHRVCGLEYRENCSAGIQQRTGRRLAALSSLRRAGTELSSTKVKSTESEKTGTDGIQGRTMKAGPISPSVIRLVSAVSFLVWLLASTCAVCKRGSADAYMKGDSLAALDTVGMGRNAPVLKTGRVSAYQNQKLRLRISLYTDQSHREFNYLILYDGDPAKGGKQFWMERVHTGDAVKGTKGRGSDTAHPRRSQDNCQPD